MCQSSSLSTQSTQYSVMSKHSLFENDRRLRSVTPWRNFTLKDFRRKSPILLQERPTLICVISGGSHSAVARAFFDVLRTSNIKIEHVEHESVALLQEWCMDTGHRPVVVLPEPGKGFRPRALTQSSAWTFFHQHVHFADWMVSIGTDPKTRYEQCVYQMGLWFGSKWAAPQTLGEEKKCQLVFPWGVSPAGDSLIVT